MDLLPHGENDELDIADEQLGIRWDEQVAAEHQESDGEEAIRLLLRKYHTGQFYFQSSHLTWRRYLEILRLGAQVRPLKGLTASHSQEGGFALPATDEAAFCFRYVCCEDCWEAYQRRCTLTSNILG